MVSPHITRLRNEGGREGGVSTHIFRPRARQQTQLLLLHVPRIQILQLHLTRAPSPKNEDLTAVLVHHTGVRDPGLGGHAS